VACAAATPLRGVGLVTTLWIHGQTLHALGKDGAGPLAEIVSNIRTTPLSPPQGVLERTVGAFRYQLAGLLPGTIGILEAQPTAGAASTASDRLRALLVPAAALDELEGELWANVYPRLLDVSNIDEARSRAGLKFLQQGAVSTIFIPGTYLRLTFVLEAGLGVIQHAVDAEIFSTHSRSRSFPQPSAGERETWSKLHRVASETRAAAARLRTAPRTAPVATTAELAPLKDGWITLQRLHEYGVQDDAAKRPILALNDENDLADVMGMVPDETYDSIERAFRTHLERQRRRQAREREAQFTEIEIVKLSESATRHIEGEMSFEGALAQLTGPQRAVACRDVDTPMRLKGGPGTGKSLTAILRAGFLARRAKERGVPTRIGFFVFNADLGRHVATRMAAYGLSEFLEPDSPQSIVVTSLHEWCRRFVKLDELGVEPLHPYRADRTQADRRAALELAVDEARARLGGPEYGPLWDTFDAKSKTGLREIETEISQFIKARDIGDIQSYLSERRPANWWLSGTSRAFKTFVWEVATIYNDVLRRLGFMDADDLTNDAVKEVSKSVWQTYQKPAAGFDYLILDEAQDFFRNQLTLVRQIVKRPDGFMMCFDESQAVYSRYPSLRDIGFDTSVRFESSRLERNFRSTREIVAAIRILATKYPTIGLEENWGELEASDEQPSGPKPRASGFATEDGMLRQTEDLVRAALAAGVKPPSVAIIAFDDALVDRMASRLQAAKVPTHVLEGDGKRGSARAVNVANARHVKGQQFDTCILVGLDRDSFPDARNVKSNLHLETRREDDLRVFVVALSRTRRALHLLWHGAEPSEFVAALEHTIERTE
jgi:superfamily I DNA/RNA helicase